MMAVVNPEYNSPKVLIFDVGLSVVNPEPNSPSFFLPSSHQQTSAEFPALRSQKSSSKPKQSAAATAPTAAKAAPVKPKKEEVCATWSTLP